MKDQQSHMVLAGTTSEGLWILSWLLLGSYQWDYCIHAFEALTPGTPKYWASGK